MDPSSWLRESSSTSGESTRESLLGSLQSPLRLGGGGYASRAHDQLRNTLGGIYAPMRLKQMAANEEEEEGEEDDTQGGTGRRKKNKKASSSSASLDEDGYPTNTSWTSLWILFWYAYIAALQSLLWMTFSSVPDDSRAWLHTDNATLDLWLDWGPVAYCCSVGLALWLLSSRLDGLRISVRLGASLCFLASALRCVPAFLSDDDRQSYSTYVLASIHVAQFINGAVAPLVVTSPSFLSLLWFPASSRNTATAVANVSSALGRAIGFFLGPALVSQPNDLTTLLAVEVGLAALPLLAVLIYYPAEPSSPPSKAAEAEIHRMKQKLLNGSNGDDEGEEEEEDNEIDMFVSGGYATRQQQKKNNTKNNSSKQTNKKKKTTTTSTSSGLSFCTSASNTAAEVWTAICVPSFFILALAGGLEMAVYGAWSGTLPTVLSPQFTDVQAGIFGSVNTFAGIGGGILVGFLTDIPALRHRLKGVVQVLALLSAGAFAVFALSLPPFQMDQISSALGYMGLLGICAAAGFLRGGTDPLFFELSAEVVAPAGVPAGAAGGVLTFWYHIILCGFLSVPASFIDHWVLAGMAGLMGLSAILLIPVSVKYTRR